MTDLEAAEHLDKVKEIQEGLIRHVFGQRKEVTSLQMIVFKPMDPLRVELMRARYERLISALAHLPAEKDGKWIAKANALALKIKFWLRLFDRNSRSY